MHVIVRAFNRGNNAKLLCSNETVLILLIMQYCGTTNELLQYVFQYMMDGMGIGVAP